MYPRSPDLFDPDPSRFSVPYNDRSQVEISLILLFIRPPRHVLRKPSIRGTTWKSREGRLSEDDGCGGHGSLPFKITSSREALNLETMRRSGLFIDGDGAQSTGTQPICLINRWRQVVGGVSDTFDFETPSDKESVEKEVSYFHLLPILLANR